MGVSDSFICLQQQIFMKALLDSGHIINKDHQSFKIAHLGNVTDNFTVTFCKKLFPNAQHDLYDILLKNWDINGEWGIENYDIVICHRTTMYVEDLDFFIKQLKKCISKNENVIFDFTLYNGFLENYTMTKKRFPPSLTAKFDFRKTFEEVVRTVTVYDGQRTSHMTIESFMDPQGTNPICLKQDYFDATMTNCVTERTLEENNIKPNVLVNGYNFFKGDLITYMFWNKKQMQTFASSYLTITIPPGNRI